MKRFLVVLMGDGDNYINSFIAAEITKGGEPTVKRLINRAGGRSWVEPYSPNSTLRWVYKIIHGESRKDVLNEDDMELLYKASIQKYNEDINGK